VSNCSLPACTNRIAAIPVMGFEILHAWKSVSEFPPIVEIHLDVMDPWSRMAIDTDGEPISARNSAADSFAVS